MTEQSDDLEALAADFVLGTLDADAWAEAQRRLESEPEFARAVERWQQRFAPLADATPEVEPPSRVWRAIERRLDGGAEKVAASFEVSTGLRRRLAFWRWATLGTSLAAVALAAVLALRVVTTVPAGSERQFVAMLSSGKDQPTWIASVDLARHTMTVRALSDVMAMARNKSFQLWLIELGQPEPKSLGLLDPNGQTDVRLGASGVTHAVLAVSLEPPGGSPTGQPTGPVVFQGKLVPLPKH